MIRFAILLAALVGLAACETVGGMGRDVESAGEALQGTAQDVQDEI